MTRAGSSPWLGASTRISSLRYDLDLDGHAHDFGIAVASRTHTPHPPPLRAAPLPALAVLAGEGWSKRLAPSGPPFNGLPKPPDFDEYPRPTGRRAAPLAGRARGRAPWDKLVTANPPATETGSATATASPPVRASPSCRRSRSIPIQIGRAHV